MTRILVVDDDSSLRHSLSKFLRACGHEVLEASNGIEALRQLNLTSVDLVITDINMPGMDGIETVVALRDIAPGVAVIAMSGGGLFGKEMLLDSAAALGADVTLQKPLDLAELKSAIEALGGRSKQGKGGP